MPDATIVLAGATGDLGGRVARALIARGATVRALVRPSADAAKLDGVDVVRLDFADAAALAEACRGAGCVVSTISGLSDVIVDAQSRLLDAAVAAGVPRFMPSDFSIDFTKLPEGRNRNLDLRRAFRRRLDAAPVRATSIFNGAFAELLTGPMPLVQRPMRRVLYWRSADQPLDFTAKDDVAAFTAAAALDPDAPRDLRVAGDSPTVRDLARVMTELTGQRYKPLYAGWLGLLGAMIRVAHVVAPKPGELYPAWQGMQYTRDMFDGRGRLEPLDNDRYGAVRWTSVRDVLAAR